MSVCKSSVHAMCLFLAILPTCLLSADIRGRVVINRTWSSQPEPLYGVAVYMAPVGNPIARMEALVGKSGYYYFQGVPSGQYFIQVGPRGKGDYNPSGQQYIFVPYEGYITVPDIIVE